MTHKDALIKIGNLIGTPVPAYYGAEAQRQLAEKKLADVSKIVQEALGVTAPAVDPEKHRTNPGVDKILGGVYTTKTIGD